jgi:hypothetical protein
MKTFVKDGRTYTSIKNLFKWDKNPREITTDEHDQLKEIIERQGQRHPLQVNTGEKWGKEGQLLGGNHRIDVYAELGIEDVWVNLNSPADEKEAIELAFTDNQHFAPETYATHTQTTDKVLRDYVIPGTPFTSGIVNKNNPLKYHFDSGNFKEVFSTMLAIRGGTAGGHLALPAYDVGLAIANNSVTIFDGQQILHGVTPIKFLTPDAYRFTIVYYSLRKMWDCLPLREEVERIRNVKFEREKKRMAK